MDDLSSKEEHGQLCDIVALVCHINEWSPVTADGARAKSQTIYSVPLPQDDGTISNGIFKLAGTFAVNMTL